MSTRRSGCCAPAGLNVPDEVRLEAAGVADIEGLPFPCALKVCSPDILHKTDSGGVRLNVTSENFAESSARNEQSLSRLAAASLADGKLLGTEMIFGALHDTTFGPAVMTGAGGTLTELYRDTAFRLAPCGSSTAAEMLDELQIAPVLNGFRGSSLDRAALAETVARFQSLPR